MMEINDDHHHDVHVHVNGQQQQMMNNNNISFNDNHSNYNYNNNVTNHMLQLIKNETYWHNTDSTTTAIANHSFQNNQTNTAIATITTSNSTITSTTLATTTTLNVFNVTEDIRNLLLFNNFDNSFISTYNNNTAIINDVDLSSTLKFVNDSLSTKENDDFTSNTWWNTWWTSKPFPSGYSQLSIVLLAFFLTCIIILVVVGNLLVCIAIATEKSLKPVQNWFIASLAVSDLLIGLIIMPFSLARELMGYWMFGQVWCDIHAALDVLLCTASINSLFLISLDRYWSITQAVKYLKKRTPSRAAMMIAFVWIFSAFVSLPPLVGWKKAEQSSEYPQCNLSDDIGYVLYSAIGSFYFPALMMVFVYAKIFIAARSRARKHIAKKRFKIPSNINTVNADTLKEKSTTTTLCTSFSNPSPPEKNINIIINNNSNNNNNENQSINNTGTDANTGSSDNSSHHHLHHHSHHCHQHHSDDNDNQNHEKQESSENLMLEKSKTQIRGSILMENNNRIDVIEQNENNLEPNPNSIIPTPQIIIETSSDSRRQSWNIISTSEIISTINTNQTSDSDIVNIQQRQQQQDNFDNRCSKTINKDTTIEDSKQDLECEKYRLHCSMDEIKNQESNESNNNPNNNKNNNNNSNDNTAKRAYFSKVKYKHFKFQKPKINGLTKNTSGSISKSGNNNNNNNTNTTIDDDSDTADSPTNKDSGGCETKSFLSAPKLLRSRFGSTMSIADYDDSDAIDDDHNNNNTNNNNNNNSTKKKSAKNRVQYQDQQPIHLPSDAERHKRKIAKARERRATLIVGLIMAAFITAWLPFFVLYVLVALCQKCKETIPEGVFAVAFWLGYGNSAANPIIYTIFNRDYRKAFRKILFKR